MIRKNSLSVLKILIVTNIILAGFAWISLAHGAVLESQTVFDTQSTSFIDNAFWRTDLNSGIIGDVDGVDLYFYSLSTNPSTDHWLSVNLVVDGVSHISDYLQPQFAGNYEYNFTFSPPVILDGTESSVYLKGQYFGGGNMRILGSATDEYSGGHCSRPDTNALCPSPILDLYFVLNGTAPVPLTPIFLNGDIGTTTCTYTSSSSVCNTTKDMDGVDLMLLYSLFGIWGLSFGMFGVKMFKDFT